MKFAMTVTYIIVFLVPGTLLPADVYAGGGHHRHGHGHHHGHRYNYGDSFNIGFSFVFTPYTYGYPNYTPVPVYTYPARLPAARNMLDRRTNNATREKPAYCREYTKQILLDGQTVGAYGTACLQDNGSWRIMN